jgi:hypothetical protein
MGKSFMGKSLPEKSGQIFCPLDMMTKIFADAIKVY